MGILSDNPSALDIYDGVTNGSVTLAPSPSDNTTCTITHHGTGSAIIRTAGRMGYVRLDNNNKLKLGNVNLNLGNDGMLAMLIRVPSSKTLEAIGTNKIQFLTANQLNGSTPQVAIAARGAGNSGNASGRQIVLEAANNNGSLSVTPMFKNDGTGLNPAKAKNVAPHISDFTPFGSVAAVPSSVDGNGANTYQVARLTNYDKWMWVIMLRSSINRTQSSQATISETAAWCFGNSTNLGWCLADNTLEEQHPSSVIINGASRSALSGAATNLPLTLSNLDFTLGGTPNHDDSYFDLAKIIKIDSAPDVNKVLALLRGAALEDVGITPGTNNFMLNMGSLAAAGSLITEVGSFTAGNWKSDATDGPFCNYPIGKVTNGAPLVLTITNGRVIL